MPGRQVGEVDRPGSAENSPEIQALHHLLHQAVANGDPASISQLRLLIERWNRLPREVREMIGRVVLLTPLR